MSGGVSARRRVPEKVVPPAAGAGARAPGIRPPISGERLDYLDNLKTLLIAGIIAAHAIEGYSTFGSWTYQDFQEVTLSPVVEIITTVAVVALGGLFLMALFFLISGLFTEDSLARKGPSRFVSDRLLRLGIPFAVYTLLVWPLLEYSLFGPLMHRGFWNSVSDADPILDNGPMWFVGVLLLYSLALVAWRKVFPPSAPVAGPLRVRTLVLTALGIGVATFLVRIVFAADTNQPVNVHLWAWPEYIALFGLGIAAARHGWLRPVPDRLARGCGIAALVAILATAASVLSAEPLGLTEDAYFGGLRVTAFLAAMTEGVIAVSAPIWVLAFAQRHLNGIHAAGPGDRRPRAAATPDRPHRRRQGVPGRDVRDRRVVRTRVAARHPDAPAPDPVT
jgi:fucose 4-O-acetylase-like acetyltransferase